MLKVFYLIFLILCLLSIVAHLWKPSSTPNGKTVITWALQENESSRSQIALINEMLPSTEVRLDSANQENVKVIVQSLAGVGPDMFVCFDDWSLEAYVKAGIAEDITDRVNALGLDLKNNLWNGANTTYKYWDDRIYGFPLNVAVECLWYHEDLLRKANVLLPANGMKWDEFLPIAEKLTIRDESGKVTQYGFAINWARWRQYVWQFGGSVFNETGTRCILDSAAAIKGIQMMWDLIYHYKVAPSPIAEAAMASQGGWGTELISQFGSKRIATTFGGRWWLIILRNYSNLELCAIEGPHGTHRVFTSYGKSLMFNKRSEHLEASLSVLNVITSEPYHALINKHADGVGPLKKYSLPPRSLDNPLYPNEDYNAVWHEAMAYAKPEPGSPFVNSLKAERIITSQLDLVKNNYKSPAEAMKTAAREVNQLIRESINKRPDLQKLYQQTTGHPWEGNQP